MVSLKIIINFDNCQGIDENSSQKVREIIETPRKYALVKKASEGIGANTIGFGEKIPNMIASISFRVYASKKNIMNETLSQILNEIEEIGHKFTYDFCPLSIIFDDGGIDEEVFKKIISKQRTHGYGKIKNNGIDIKDINTKNMNLPVFTLVCDKKDYVPLLFEIVEDFKKLGYNFEVRGG